jgi:hypothetical protein
MEMSGYVYGPAALTPGKNSGTHWTGGWVGPQSHSGRFGEEKNLLHLPEFEPHTVQPVA